MKKRNFLFADRVSEFADEEMLGVPHPPPPYPPLATPLVFIMKNKGEVLDKFKKFVNLAENVTGQHVKVLRSDNGGEYGSKEFIEFCKRRGIKKEATVP